MTRWIFFGACGRGIRSRVREEEWEGGQRGGCVYKSCWEGWVSGLFCVFVLFVFALLFVPNSGGLLCYLGVLRRSASAFFLPFLSSPINDIDFVLLVLFTPTDDDDDENNKEEDIKRIRSVSSDREKEKRRRTVNRAC
jgi:hypothetical protein